MLRTSLVRRCSPRPLEAVPTDAPAVQPVATQLSTGDAHGQHVGARVLDTSSAAQGAVQHPAHGQATPAVQVPATSGDDADGPAQQVQEGHGESAQVFTLRHRPDVQSGAATEQAASLLDTPTGAAQDAGAQLVIDPVQEAAVLRERGDSRMPEEQLLAVLRGIAAGDAHAAISRATGASRTTIKRLAELVPTEPDESDSEVSGPEGDACDACPP
ncbi:hypothetical protein ACFOJ6_02700 [Gordonia humi]|uniref:hypothetical protein n=1 Tax=Gordonia humi TaxID=686429 RepID=UPI0036060233